MPTDERKGKTVLIITMSGVHRKGKFIERRDEHVIVSIFDFFSGRRVTKAIPAATIRELVFDPIS